MWEPASDELKQRLCQKFNTSLQQVEKDVEVLKEWIRQQPHLPQCSSDTFLTTLLIGSKNRMERAKEKVENYYTARLRLPDFFRDRDPESEQVRVSYETIRYFMLPKFTPDGYRLHMNIFLEGGGPKYEIQPYFKRIVCAEDIRYNSESYSLGDYIILDCKYVTITHVLKLTPTLARDLLDCVQEVMPLQIKGVFVINAPSFVDIAINIMKPFIKTKIFKRIHVFKEGPEALERYFPRKLLPRDYGGEEETSEKLQEAYRLLLREKKDWLMAEGSLTVDEKKRVGGARKNGFQEMQGSFKNLCVD